MQKDAQMLSMMAVLSGPYSVDTFFFMRYGLHLKSCKIQVFRFLLLWLIVAIAETVADNLFLLLWLLLAPKCQQFVR